MSDVQTNWILKLVDVISAPMKSAMGTTDDMKNVVERTSDALDTMGASARKAAEEALDRHKALSDMVDHEKTRLKGLYEWLNKNADDSYAQEVKFEIDKATENIKRYEGKLAGLEAQLEEIERNPDPNKTKNNWSAIVLGANQAWEVVQKVVDSLSFATDITDLSTNLQRMTDLTGNELDELTAKVHNVSKVYGEDSMDIARAANATSKQMGISYDEALSLIEQGFQKGANLNGDMLDQLKEYAPHMKQAGLSAAEGIALMAKAGKDGILSDKSLDAIKEANLSLREMGQAQVDALQGIGIEVEDLAGKTTWEAVQMISKAMDGATTQAKQLVLADIFKGAGEDAGLGFISGLNNVDLDINNIQSVQEAGEGIKGWLADMESWFADSFGNIAVYGKEFGGVAQLIAGMIPIVQGLTKVTWLQNIATKAATISQTLLNAAFVSSPLGWVALALGAVTAAVVYAWNKFEGFRGVVYGLWETFKQVFSNIKGLFSAVFSPIAETIAAINKGDWAGAAKAAYKLNPISTAKRTYDYIKGGGLTKGVGDAYNRGYGKGVQSFKDDKKPDAATNNGGFPFMPAGATADDGFATLDGIDNSNSGSKKKSRAGSGNSSKDLVIEGTKGGNTITQNLTVNNYFSGIKDKLDVQKIAAEVVQTINANLRDGLIQYG